MVTPIRLGKANDIHTAKERLIEEMRLWANETYSRHQDTPWTGVHDEGTFLTSFREYYALTQDEKLRDFVFEMLEAADEWLATNLYDGYWKRQEVHHGVEHFIIFLAWLYELDPDHPIVHKQLKNAARHIIETREKNQPWFSFEKNLFYGMRLGSKSMKKARLNIVEHLRLVRLGWLGYAVDPQAKYPKFITNYTEKWAQHIVESEEVPVYEHTHEENWWTRFLFKLALKSFIGAAPKEMTSSTRSEIHIANGSPALFMKMYEITQDTLYLDAVRKILLPVQDQLRSPYAHPLGELFWQYSQFAEIPNLTTQVTEIWEHWKDVDWSNVTLTLQTGVNWKSTEFHNMVGIRKDMPALVYEGLPESYSLPPSPATFGLIYRVLNDPQALICALDIAHAVLKLGTQLFPDGRTHGCGSETVSACCVGHGRNWGAGYVSTAVRAAIGPKCFNVELPDIKID